MGNKIRIKIKRNSGSLKYENFCLWNFKMKIIHSGIKNKSDSYRTIDDNARKPNDNIYNFVFFDIENSNIIVTRKTNRDSVKPNIEFSISL